MRVYTPGNNTTADERLLAAARDDNLDLLLEVFDKPDPFDINCKDGFVHRLQPDYRTPHRIEI
jgi:hypothetical protein